MLHVMLREGLVRRAVHPARTRRTSTRSTIAAWTPEAAAAVCGVPAEADRRGGAAVRQRRRRRCRSTARASTSPRAARRRTRRSSTCTSPPARSASRAPGPSASPASRTRWAGARSAAWRTCFPRTEILRNPKASKRSRRRCGACGASRNGPARPRWRCSRPSRRARSRRSGSPAPTRRSRCPTRTLVREALERAELVVVQDAYRDTETCGLRRRVPARGRLGREGGHRHQLRAAHLARARRRAAAGRSAAGLEDRRRFRRAGCLPDGRKAVSLRKRRKSIFNEHRETTRGRDLDITGLSYALLAERGPQQWPFPEGASGGPQAPVRGRRVPDAVGPRALRADAVPAGGGGAGRALPAAAHHRAAARPVAHHEPHRHRRQPVRARAGAARRRPSGRPRSPGNQGIRNW